MFPESDRQRFAKFVAIALASIAVSVAAFILATYVSGLLAERVPVVNLFMSIMLCTAGLVLSGMALHGRGSWREVAGLALPALVAAIAAFRLGIVGVFFVLVVGSVIHTIVRWRRSAKPAGE